MISAVAFAFVLFLAVLYVAVSRATRCLRDQIERAEKWVKA